MYRMKNALLTLFLFLAITLSAADVQAKGNSCYASIIMDADTGVILEQQNADKALHPASLTKIMTL